MHLLLRFLSILVLFLQPALTTHTSQLQINVMPVPDTATHEGLAVSGLTVYVTEGLQGHQEDHALVTNI